MKCEIRDIILDKGPMTKINTRVMVTELPLLRAKHGADKVTDVGPAGEKEINPEEEFARLQRVYGRYSDEVTWAEHILGRDYAGVDAITAMAKRRPRGARAEDAVA